MPKFSFFLNNEQGSNWIIPVFKKQGGENNRGDMPGSIFAVFFRLKGVAHKKSSEVFLKICICVYCQRVS